LTCGYGFIPVLEDVSFEVRPGEMVALLGANGAGKSTAMRAVSGLLRPVGGAIVLGDNTVQHLPAHTIAKSGLALVPEGRQVFPELTVLDNLLLGASTRKTIDIKVEVDNLLRRFPKLRNRLVSPRAFYLAASSRCLRSRAG
jgi:ABC-type branched-subunit amino acid transport system ATPase component